MNLRIDDTPREARERLALFLPASLMRELRNRIPAGSRAAFVASALRRALHELEQEHATASTASEERRA